MRVYIVDTTLRDGEQRAGVAFSVEEKVKLAMWMAKSGIDQIEAGIPAMGLVEEEGIYQMMSLGLHAKISTWNRMVLSDIQKAVALRADILHISIPSSEVQRRERLKQSMTWVEKQASEAVYFSLSNGMETTVGLEDASRASMGDLLLLCELVKKLGVKRVRYADTLGLATPLKILHDVQTIQKETGLAIEIHAHEDFGMAVANSLAAFEGGASYLNCTLGGLGERAGNCDCIKLWQALAVQYGEKILSINEEIYHADNWVKKRIKNAL